MGTGCLTFDKTGETRLKVDSLRAGIKQLTGTAVDKTGLNLVPTAFMAGFQCHAIQKRSK